MYDSIKDWINVPVTIKPFVKRTGTGGKVYDTPVDILCYPNAEVKVVQNFNGVEVTSNTQLYIDGSERIDKQDCVIFENEEHTIHAINTFYRSGKPDIKVVYI